MLIVASDLNALVAQMRTDSHTWFPAIHNFDSYVPLEVFYAMGLAGEAGEALDEVKKVCRTGRWTVEAREKLAYELADTFVYLLLLADRMGIDLEGAYNAKRLQNLVRFGEPQQGE